MAPGGEPLSASASGPGSRRWTPHGTHALAFYDRSKVVGLCGPAGTGKSRTWLEKMHLLCEKYDNLRCLITRKTRESLTEAALFTLEDEVIPEGHPALDGPRRTHKTQYNYPNGSVIVVCGLDKPQKIMSTQFDVIYVQEMIECDADDLDMLLSRLRNYVLPYQQLLFDTNPAQETHWIKVASDNGDFKMYNTHHQDNPVYWEEAPPEVQRRAARRPVGTQVEYTWPEQAPDGRIGRWTPEGKDYVFSTLGGLKGARRKRLLLGLWASAEGSVFEEEWDDDANTLEAGWLPPQTWRRFWSVDFGFSVPMSIQAWALDKDERMYMYREVYHSHRLVRQNAKDMLEACGWSWDEEEMAHTRLRDDAEPLPEAVVCDWDAEGRADFEAATGLRTVAAYKGIINGLQAVKLRMQPAGDGRKRLYLARGAVVERDRSLKDRGKPQSTLEEIGGYVWPDPKKAAPVGLGSKNRPEIPVQVDDHGMDNMRYAVCYVDGVNDRWRARDVPNAAVADAGAAGVTAVPVVKMHRSEVSGVGHTGTEVGFAGRGRRGRGVQWPPPGLRTAPRRR